MAKLEEWHDKGIIELKKTNTKAVFRISKHLPATAADIKLLVPIVYRALQKYESDELRKMKEVVTFLTGNGCFLTRLSKRTDDTGTEHNTGFRCDNCTWCKTRAPMQSPIPPTPAWNRELFGKVSTAIGQRDDARFLAFVAFGVESPRVLREGLNRPGTVFGSMVGHDFDVSDLVCLLNVAKQPTNKPNRSYTMLLSSAVPKPVRKIIILPLRRALQPLPPRHRADRLPITPQDREVLRLQDGIQPAARQRRDLISKKGHHHEGISQAGVGITESSHLFLLVGGR